MDSYQHFVDGTSAAQGDMADRIASRLGQGPAVEPVAKPAPPLVCNSQFGNTDVFVSVITP